MKLIDFLRIYSFRFFDDDAETEIGKMNSDTIRIVIDDNNPENWFEIGVNDWYIEPKKESILHSVINENILNSEIITIYTDFEIDTLVVVLKGEEYN